MRWHNQDLAVFWGGGWVATSTVYDRTKSYVS